jgi:hypothetical protein
VTVLLQVGPKEEGAEMENGRKEKMSKEIMSCPMKFRIGLVAFGTKRKLKERRGVLRKLAFSGVLKCFKIKYNKSTHKFLCFICGKGMCFRIYNSIIFTY